jgi:hypothetical protein
MKHPLLYQINTRCWLRELSQRHGADITLANIPASEFAFWQARGFTHLWLMGVWTVGPRVRAEAFKYADLLNAYNFLVPGWTAEDVLGSPYAIGDYHVSPALGGDDELKKFREQLHAHGMKLILDFVPNHLGLDHPWLREQPEFFVQGSDETQGVFQHQTVRGPRWLAHGKDPHFAPWIDTVQVDYRRAETRTAMLALLQSVAARCDGVRCDMAMLLLNDVFARTWTHLPAQPSAQPAPTTEFWADAIPAVQRAQPGFIFLAEVYWSLEGHLQSLGFDFTYDKHLFDLLVNHRAAEPQVYLAASPEKYIHASAHFLENHDEHRIAPRLAPAEHRAAALLTLALPGMRFLHEGQLTGYPHHIPVQLGRRPEIASDKTVEEIYETLLTVLQKTAIGHGAAKILAPRRAHPDNASAENFVVILWQAQPTEFDLVIVNLAPFRSECRVALPVAALAAHDWQLRDLLGSERYERTGEELDEQGLFLNVPAHAAQIFRFEPK